MSIRLKFEKKDQLPSSLLEVEEQVWVRLREGIHIENSHTEGCNIQVHNICVRSHIEDILDISDIPIQCSGI